MSDESKQPEEDRKILVDEDWKEQVAREKEAALSGAANRPPDDDAAAEGDTAVDADAGTSTGADTDEPVGKPEPQASAAHDTEPQLSAEPRSAPDSGAAPTMPVPPASFEFLVSMLFTQAMSFLGQIPDPGTGETRVEKAMAKHGIDTLELLSDKTKGNLTDDESRMLADALHALRMTFVNVKG